jgi:hypothetical protein
MKRTVGVYSLAFVGATVLNCALLVTGGVVFWLFPIFFAFLYLPALILHALLLHVLGAAMTRRIAIGWAALAVAVYAIGGALAYLSLRAERALIAEIDAGNARRVVVPSSPLAFTEMSLDAAHVLFRYDIPAVFAVSGLQGRTPVVYTYRQAEDCRNLPVYMRDYTRRDLSPHERPCVVRAEADRPASVVLVARARETFNRYLASAELTVDTVSIPEADGFRPVLRLRRGLVQSWNPLWFTVPNPYFGLRLQHVGARDDEALAAALSLRPRL